MKAWNFQVNNSPQEISQKLESSLGVADRFVFKLDAHENNPVQFKLRKRFLLPFEINTQNNLIVNGKIVKAAAGNKTDIEVSFAQHPLALLLIYGHIILGLGILVGIFLNLSSNSYMYLFGGSLLAIGILLGFHLKKDFDKNVQEYKFLIAKILEF
ncbi:hypothetical protein [Salegentibacter sediminis]|uniref:hypothetical protein n=1 Tax=Salegentibacter sediminis TaxID=1930251 RepID=UPI0009C0BBF6|nr:hypothetical protein [Salegentibacter sediminis]